MDAATILKRRNSSPRNAKTWQDTPVRMGVAKIQHIGMTRVLGHFAMGKVANSSKYAAQTLFIALNM